MVAEALMGRGRGGRLATPHLPGTQEGAIVLDAPS
jgi:hypothetical protein